MKHDTWKVFVVDRIRIMLCFQADAGTCRIWNAGLARKAHVTACNIKLQTRLVGKAGHADTALLGLEYSCLTQTGSVDDKVMVISAKLAELLIFGII